MKPPANRDGSIEAGRTTRDRILTLIPQPPPNLHPRSDHTAYKAWQIRSCDPAQTTAIGTVVAQHAACGDLIALTGELGSGKTQFVRGLARGLGINEADVSSPSYVLIHEYKVSSASPVLVHIDVYRTGGSSDLDSIGWDEATNEHRTGAVVAVEWADRLAGRLGDDVLHVRLDHVDTTSRLIAFNGTGSWMARMAPLIAAMQDLESTFPVPPEDQHMRGTSTGQQRVPDAPPRCPICNAPVPHDAMTHPFCSSRCRLIDLNYWLSGNYVIRRPINHNDLDDS